MSYIWKLQNKARENISLWPGSNSAAFEFSSCMPRKGFSSKFQLQMVSCIRAGSRIMIYKNGWGMQQYNWKNETVTISNFHPLLVWLTKGLQKWQRSDFCKTAKQILTWRHKHEMLCWKEPQKRAWAAERSREAHQIEEIHPLVNRTNPYQSLKTFVWLIIKLLSCTSILDIALLGNVQYENSYKNSLH